MILGSVQGEREALDLLNCWSYPYLYMSVCVCVSDRPCVCVSGSMYVCVSVCLLLCMCAFLSVFLFLCVHVCVMLYEINTPNDHTQAKRSLGMVKWSRTIVWCPSHQFNPE